MKVFSVNFVVVISVAHKELKKERKTLYHKAIEREKHHEQEESKVDTQAHAQISVVGEPSGNGWLVKSVEWARTPIFFASHGSKYFVMLRHVLGTQCVPEFDKVNKILLLKFIHKSYLLPDEAKVTQLKQLKPTWNGYFENCGDDRQVTSRQAIQMPVDCNMEENCIERNDAQTVCGWLVEFVFQKQVLGGEHLLPSKSLWDLFEEKVKTEREQDKVTRKALEAKKDNGPDGK
jgi:hypothetical protein